MNRRQSLTLLAGTVAGASLFRPGVAFAQAPAPAPAAGHFKLPELGYAENALEPHIDAQTMNIHRTRHHAAYVNNLNGLIERWPDLAKLPIEQILADMSKVPEAVRTPVRNNLGGHWNHVYFWDLMTPGGAKAPAGDLKAAIDQAFGGQKQMTDKVNAAGGARFGSGWAWLVVTKDKKLDVVSTPNQDTPHMEGHRGAVVGVDVWEHAYYLKYQNRRADYLGAWWNVVNWDKAAGHFKKAMG